MLIEKSVDFLSVSGRTKSLDGALEKIRRKKYSNPEERLTDLSGIRVITYLESQVSQVETIIRILFAVDEANSLDRSSVLGSDKIGYRSAHFVCSLGTTREKLPEYDSLGNLKFEIQVRTVLQHAWAELAHDRSFKFGPGLPPTIQRKLNLYSGMLEIVDGAFDSIAKEIDNYAQEINAKSLRQISAVEVNSISLSRYVQQISDKYELDIREGEIPAELFVELERFGIQTIGDLDKLITAETIKLYKSARIQDTPVGFIRQLLMLHDIDKYFSGPVRWAAIDTDSYECLKEKYPERKLRNLFHENSISLEADDYPRDEEF
ncbi:RelA/SpoT domain-containing protein [Rhodopseudomonas sp. BR0M22]|uniref:GTP pyrophosphokinase n=1 Tax=Rhodopseudomonas sp. BR0M22 TaxID=2269369 RepID=UPI0013DFCB9B|nr:RelA/SpoT domain-containing protein [Rhodopseudomonas sp. BR0M22]